jgi:16S rRNA processing protein RimM
MNDYLMIASVLKPQGVRGECKIRSYAADTELFHQWKTLYVPDRHGNGFRPVSVQIARIRDGFVYAFLDGSQSADDAEKFRGADLYVDREHAAPVEGDAVLIADLIGCEAKDEHGAFVGTLSSVLQYGTVDTWVFDTGFGTLMAPALRSVFPEVDAEKKTILVNRDRLEEVAVRS